MNQKEVIFSSVRFTLMFETLSSFVTDSLNNTSCKHFNKKWLMTYVRKKLKDKTLSFHKA